VIGGVVYNGRFLPELVGKYFFGDFASGKIWALKSDGSSAASAKWIASLPQLSTFGLDPRTGDVLAASLKDGTIRRVVYVDPLSQSAPAGKLSQTGIFKDIAALTPADGLVPYEINVPFWSDFALKKRWFCLPQQSSPIKFDSTNNWEFPRGTFWVKHFDLERVRGRPETAVRMETRILVKTELDVYGLTYRWTDNQQDAELVPSEGADREFIVSENGADRPQLWHYPGRSECSICHTKQGGYALGFNTSQLNRRLNYGGIVTNQICALAAGGFLDTNVVSESGLVSALAPASAIEVPLQYRVRSFLAANCSQCHQPGAFGARWDARITTPLKDALIVNEPGIYTFGDNRIVVPGSVEKSEISRRLSAPVDTLFHMPPLASHELNNDGIDLVSAWITNMNAAPWRESDIGVPLFEGCASREADAVLISGGGSGMSVGTDSFHFLYQPMEGNGSIIARVSKIEQTSSNCTAGLMLRQDLGASSGCALLLANRDGWSFSIRDPLSGDQREQFLPGVPVGSWMRLKREDGKI
jgi:mono/diheme cytochrome c family protein